MPQEPPYSFADAAAAYAALGHDVDVATLAAANATRPGILDPAAVLTSRHYIAGEGDTLAANASGATRARLAEVNGDTDDLFEAGTLLYAGDFAGVTVPSGQTLHELADRYACPQPCSWPRTPPTRSPTPCCPAASPCPMRCGCPTR